MRSSTFTAAAVVALSASTAFGQAFLDAGHFDLEIETEINATNDGVDEVKFAIKNKDFPNSPFLEEYEPDEAFLVPTSFRTQSGALGGIADGASVFFVPEVQDPATLWLGLASDDTPDNVLVDDRYEVSLIGFSGPAGGTFVASQDDGFGNPIIFIDTSDGIQNDDPLFAPVGDNHYEYAFDTLGTYELTFRASAVTETAFGGVPISATGTYTFFVPEPATAGLFGIAAMVGLRRRR
ncbi:MAG: choice-of-anchor M domain-containing protein [Planctomycetota bacterium]